MKEFNIDKSQIFNQISDVTLSQYCLGNNNELINFIFDNLPVGIVILNRTIDIVYSNKQASFFLNHFKIPEEIPSACKRVFDALDRENLQELFPGEFILTKRFENSPSTWIFKFAIPMNSHQVIVLFIIEDKISNKINVNEIRQQYRLTRREADILRRVLDGLQNTEISKDLEITEQTVKDHLSKIYKKIRVENRFHLMRSLVNPSLR
jgi:DNA-binding CsgD family transcriptional regulator